MENPTDRDDGEKLHDIAALARQAGLQLNQAEIAAMAVPFERTQAALARLRAALDQSEEPATTFEAATNRPT